MPSFQGIHSDCELIVVTLTNRLKEQLRNPTVREDFHRHSKTLKLVF